MYVSNELNHADHASRGMTADTFIKCPNWIDGTEFLTKDQKNQQISLGIKEIQKNSVEVKEVMRMLQKCMAIH